MTWYGVNFVLGRVCTVTAGAGGMEWSSLFGSRVFVHSSVVAHRFQKDKAQKTFYLFSSTKEELAV